MKILGYTFDKEAGPSIRVQNVIKKLRSRTWALLKLKRAGFTTDELLRTYTVYMRSLAEYVSVLWHSMLTAEQSAMIEREPTQALRHIYGHGPSAESMRKMSGVELLSKRRCLPAICEENCHESTLQFIFAHFRDFFRHPHLPGLHAISLPP